MAAAMRASESEREARAQAMRAQITSFRKQREIPVTDRRIRDERTREREKERIENERRQEDRARVRQNTHYHLQSRGTLCR